MTHPLPIRISGHLPTISGATTLSYQTNDDPRFTPGQPFIVNQHERWQIATRKPPDYAPNQTVTLTIIKDNTTRKWRRNQRARVNKIKRATGT